MVKGKIIVLEGISSSGKKTQAKLLVERLTREGIKAEEMSFPSYDKTLFGSLIGKYLAGEFGKKEEFVEAACLLYSLDRYQFKKQMEEKLETGVFLVLDRYSQSNMGFQGALVEEKEFDKLVEWIQAVESRLPQADAVVFFNVPRKHAEALYENKEQKNVFVKGRDIHEEDGEYEERVREAYLKLAKKFDWLVVNCVSEADALRPREEIAEDAWRELKKKRIV